MKIFKGYYIIIRGPLGCGKTTIAKEISKRINAEYFAVDGFLDENNLTGDTEEGYVSQKSFFKVNEIITSKAKNFLNKGVPIVFDGNFYWKSQIDDLVNKLNFKNYIFTLKAPLSVCIKRDKNRNKSHGKDAAEAVYKKSTEFNYGIIIDVTKPLNESIERIFSYLKSKDLKTNFLNYTL